MKPIQLFCFFVALFAATSCTKEPLKTIEIRGTVQNISKANSSGFEVGDIAGVYVVDYSNNTAGTLTANTNHASNVKHSYNIDGSFIPESGKEIYWNDNSTKVDIYGYYPYLTVESVNQHPFSVQTDQSTIKSGITLGGYEASDFLWAKKESISPFNTATLDFGHKLSRIAIQLEKGDGYTTEEFTTANKTVLINGTRIGSKIDLAMGVITVDESSSISPIKPLKVGEMFTAIIVPQIVSKLSLVIAINDITYTYQTEMTFTANIQNNVIITVNKNKIDVKSNNVVAWGENLTTYARTLYPDDPRLVYPGTDLQAVVIDGLIWAPVNCDYINGDADYKYGKLYQWGRKDGQGNQNCSFAQGPLTNSTNPTFDNPDPNTYYQYISAPWDWRSPQLLAWDMDNNNPCPVGWRVPTQSELESVFNLGSTWVDANISNPDGLPGRWYGTNNSIANLSDPKDCIFLPAAGYRNGQGSDEGSRNNYGVYWSTTPDGIFSVFLEFTKTSNRIIPEARVRGNSVRCVKTL